ncbi:hypothetical protein BKA67DRAFT_551460, partial [Truncatella angustata]
MTLSAPWGTPASLATWFTSWLACWSAPRSMPLPGWESLLSLLPAACSTLSIIPDMMIDLVVVFVMKKVWLESLCS